MLGYIIVDVTIKDMEGFMEYASCNRDLLLPQQSFVSLVNEVHGGIFAE